MALKEYFLIDRTYLFDEDDVPEGAKLVSDEEVVATVPEPIEPALQGELAEDELSTVPEDADPASVEESHTPKRRHASNKQAKPTENK